ncbi:hypothetical protein niasHS_010497 [Heterodera schachtii]|uniref:COP9 signalosome complex subunit 4 n=1 Tax=Heterodera schachtii TaxID=97005 RepID=A0ABD2IZE8_HETSC
MDMSELCAKVNAIYKKETDHKVQSEGLQKLLEGVLTSVPSDNLKQITEAVSNLVETVVNNESTSMVVSRQFIADIASYLSQPSLNTALIKGIGEAVLTQLHARALAYEEQSTQIRMILANALERDRQFDQSARTLMGIPIETGQRGYRHEFKMELYLRITELFLEADNVEEADRHVKRASLLQQDVKEEALVIKYKALYARVLDRQGNFTEAAQRYHELSLKPGLIPSEKRQVLQNALTCTLLAAPGTQRNRLLNTLFKDERCQQLVGHSLLKNMYLERLVKGPELTEFELSLCPHQRLLDAEGVSILQRSVLEHNILAASRLYANISFDGLGQLLGIPAAKAEKVATQMISGEKVQGAIDQLERTVSFEVPDSSNGGADSQIASICELVASINEKLATRFSEWHTERFNAYKRAHQQPNDLMQ